MATRRTKLAKAEREIATLRNEVTKLVAQLNAQQTPPPVVPETESQTTENK